MWMQKPNNYHKEAVAKYELNKPFFVLALINPR